MMMIKIMTVISYADAKSDFKKLMTDASEAANNNPLEQPKIFSTLLITLLRLLPVASVLICILYVFKLIVGGVKWFSGDEREKEQIYKSLKKDGFWLIGMLSATGLISFFMSLF